MRTAHFFKIRQPWTRHLAHAAFWLYLLLALGLALGFVDVPDHDFEWFLAYLAVLSAVGMLAPAVLLRALGPRNKAVQERTLGFLEVLAALAMLASWLGSFGLYRDGFGYDTFVHFFASALIAVMAVVASVTAGNGKTKQVVIIAVVIVLAAGAVNEAFEYAGDRFLGTAMYGEAGEPEDTLKDLVANVAGLAVGSFFAIRRYDSLR